MQDRSFSSQRAAWGARSIRSRLTLALIAAAIVFSACFVVPGVASAQVPREYQQAVDKRRAELEKLGKDVPKAEVKELLELRDEVRTLLDASRSGRAPFEEKVSNLRSDIERLGPVPAKDAPPEDSQITADRTALQAELAKWEAILRQADLNDGLAERTLNAIAERRREAFYEQVLERGDVPWNPKVIGTAAEGLWRATGQAADWSTGLVGRWNEAGSLARHLFWLAAAFVLAFVVFFPVRRYVERRIVRVMQRVDPSPSRRTIAAAAITVGRVLPGIVAGGIIYQVVRWVGGIEQGGEALARTVWLWFLVMLAVNGATRAVFAPKVPGWHLIRLKLAARLSVHALLLTAAATLAIDAVLQKAARLMAMPEQWNLLQSAAVSVVLAVCIFLLTRGKLWRQVETSEDGALPEQRKAEDTDSTADVPGAVRFMPEGLKSAAGTVVEAGARILPKLLVLAALLSLVIIGATAFGSVALGYFLSTRFFVLLGLVLAAWGVRAILLEAIAILVPKFAPAASAESEFEADGERPHGSLLSFWLGLVVDVLVVVLFAPTVFVALGADPTDVQATVRDAFYGFKVGNVTISVANLLSAILVFAVILAITRFVQRVADTRLFPSLRIDSGVSDSFKTLIGYVGFVIAALAAIGTVGLDLSNIAIVAGALSVGIGFGLQSIVNNFVSGLILLFERPIKKGDWIRVASGEGLVKRISVRSTEITTADRASVIVPNSELISGTVTNMTHGDKIGRFIVPIGVSYDSDPEEVTALLLEIVRSTPLIMRFPEPFVYFAGFGDSSLDFEVRAFVRDVAHSLKVRGDLRIAIHKRFRERGVEIPYPHRTVIVGKGSVESVFMKDVNSDIETGPESADGAANERDGTSGGVPKGRRRRTKEDVAG